jgi:putative DNA primase/helicase
MEKQVTEINVESIPKKLKGLRQWVLYRLEWNDDRKKYDKIPYQTNGNKARTNDPDTWATFEDAIKAVDIGSFGGVGFVFSKGDPFCGIDFDDCIGSDGKIAAWAHEWVHQLNSYTEYSPSGEGLHIILEGIPPAGGNKKGNYECYNHGRFFTVTGAHVADTPLTIESRQTELDEFHRDIFGQQKPETLSMNTGSALLSDDEILAKARVAKNGDKFNRLWSGNVNGYDSPSEADLALCGILAFFANKDPQCVDRLFRQSGLMRPKWDRNHYADGRTYGQETISKAIKECHLPDMPEENHDSAIDVVTYDYTKKGKELQIFTPDLLPEGVLRDYVDFAYPLTEASMQYHIATGLGMIAGILGRNICLKDGANTLYTNLYMLVVGESGMARKSTALNICYKFLPHIDPKLILGVVMSLEGCLEAFQNHNTHMVIYDEIKQLIVNDEKNYGKGLITLYTTLWGCPPAYRVDTKNVKQDKRMILNPTLSILAATTPNWLELKEQDVLGGFLGRFLPIYADTQDKRRLPIPPPMDDKCLQDLIEKFQKVGKMSGEYQWDEDAKPTFVKIYDKLCDDFEKEPNKALIQPYWSRVDTHIKKLAMIFDVCSPNASFRITKANIERATAVMELVTHYNRILLGKLSFSPWDQKEQRFIGLLEKTSTKWVAHSDVLRSMHISADEMQKVVKSLMEKELIETTKHGPAKKKTTYYRSKV